MIIATKFGPIEELAGRSFRNGAFSFTVKEIVGRKAIISVAGSDTEMGVGRLSVYLNGAEEVTDGCA